MRVLLLHGWGGSDFPHWQSWLAGELAKAYGTVQFLRFSDVEHPKLTLWLDELEEALDSFKPDVVVAHSLANTLWFHLCNTQEIAQIQKLYLVAPPSMACDVSELKQFFPIQAPKKLYAKETLLIASTNDPYMSEDEAQTLAKELNIPLKLLFGAGHINTNSGFGEWPWMLEELQKSKK